MKALWLFPLLALVLIALACEDDVPDPTSRTLSPDMVRAATPTPTPVPPTPTATPEPTPTPVPPTPTPTVPPPPTHIPIPTSLGQTIEAYGSAYTVHGFLDPAPAGPPPPPGAPADFRIREGMRLVALDISQVGVAIGDESDANDFALSDDQGNFHLPSVFVLAELEPVFPSTLYSSGPQRTVRLAPGEEVRGWVTFQVPKDAGLELAFAEAKKNDFYVAIGNLTNQ